ncbi:hypothetical protein DIPPA_09427 [Diplonema papillatum]|nr:hypothetical protein DIPPA_09427 [Diplonema papillatum]
MASRPSDESQLTEPEQEVLTRALESGRLKMRTHDGKTIFVNMPSAQPADSVSIAGATETAMRRAKEEAALQSEIEELESTREILEQQIDALREPVLAEARAVKALQRKCQDEEVNLTRLKTANMDAREIRQAEAAVLEARVAELHAVINHEQAERKRQHDRLHKLNEEGASLRREIDDEKRRFEWQKLEVRKCEKIQEDVLHEQKRLRQQAKHADELFDEIAATANDLRTQQKTLKTSCHELRSDLSRIKKNIVDAERTLRTKGDHSALRKEYEEKLRIWNALEAPAKLKEDVDFMEKENQNLRRNLGRAEQEYKALESTVKMLESAHQRARIASTSLNKENEALRSAMAALGEDARLLLAEEENWSTDEEGDCDEEALLNAFDRQPFQTDSQYRDALHGVLQES